MGCPRPGTGKARPHMNWLSGFLTYGILTLSLLAQDPQQPQDPERSAEPPSSELQSTDKEVDVETVTDDGRIERRLREIIATTGRFGNVAIEVRNGVASLSGEVAEAPDLKWLTNLAGNTEGVVAVMNRVKVRETPIWDLRPALLELEEMWRGFVRSLPRIAAGFLVLLLVALFAGRLTRPLSRPIERRFQSELLQTVVTKSVLVVLWLIGIYLFLRVSGLTQIAFTVVGGTGVLGLVLGFAFRDIAENFLASILISLQRPFRYGDTIQVDGHTGVVQRVTPRGTVLMDFEGNYIQIANSQVYKSTIKNFTANPKVRQDFVVGVGYDASVSRAQEVALATVAGHSAVLDDPKPIVLVEQLASATVNLRVYFWVDGSVHSTVKVRSALMRMVLGALAEEGISMPDDAREVIFPDGVPVRQLDRDRDDVSLGETDSIHADGASRVGREESRKRAQDRHDEATSAEGGLESETDQLNEQARQSRPPDDGVDILANGGRRPARTAPTP